MRHCMYVEAPLLAVLLTVLHQSPTQVCPCRVSNNQVLDLVHYLTNAIILPPWTWVHLTCAGPYHGDLGVVSADNTVLVLSKYKDNIFIGLDAGQCETTQTTTSGVNNCMPSKLEVIDLIVDAEFIERSRSLIETAHPDVAFAWQRLWKSTWPSGCSVKLDNGTEGRFCPSDAEDMALFDGKEIPLDMIERTYTPGDNLVIVVEQFSVHMVSVLSQPDLDQLLVTAVTSNAETSAIAHYVVHTYYTLDLDRFYFLVDEDWLHRDLGIVKQWDGVDDNAPWKRDCQPHPT